jgi:hypothetical protein
MSQLTLRLADDLADHLKAAAHARGMSVNRWATAVLAAAVDPALAGDEMTGVRERLRRAGLLAESPVVAGPPTAELVAAARALAGSGTPLAALVSEGRG